MVCNSLRDIGGTVAPAENDFNMPEQSCSYIIIGPGLTGAAATERIREVDQHGSILLIGADNEYGYADQMLREAVSLVGAGQPEPLASSPRD